MPLPPSTRLGFYEIISPIGSGGMGEVYRAKDTRLGREVALKVLTTGKGGDEERKQRFVKEAQAASSLQHPNIITIFDVGSENGIDYMAMEYVKGKPLEELIPRTGLRLSEVLKYGIQIADALANAHAAGIVHRDLKPANIMVTEDGQVKLLDFGLAKLTESTVLGDTESTRTTMAPALTIEGTILGTVSYMSPEQAEGKKVDTRSDIFSFGSILYELLTGKRAFQNDTMLSTLSAILRDEPPPVGEIADDNRGELERIINRCLRKDPDRRWHNMADLKIALQELREESTTGSSIGMKTPPRRPQAQPPKNAWVLGAGIVVVIAAAGWFMFGDKLRPSATPPPAPVASTGTDKPSAFPPTADAVLTNDQIIEMVKSGMKKSLIVSHIRNSKTKFSLSTPELIRLSKESVPEDVIEAMRNPHGSPIAGGSSGNAPPTPGTAPPTPGSTPAIPAAGTTAAKVILAAGEKVPLVLAADVLFSTAEDHSRLELTVGEDIKSGGQVLIAKGAPAMGSLVDAEKRKLFGRGGKITVRLESVKAVDGQTINLRPTPVVVSASKAKDKNVALAKDSAFVGYIDQEASIAPVIAPK